MRTTPPKSYLQAAKAGLDSQGAEEVPWRLKSTKRQKRLTEVGVTATRTTMVLVQGKPVAIELDMETANLAPKEDLPCRHCGKRLKSQSGQDPGRH